MVREANTKQAASEKQLKEAWGKVRTALSVASSLCRGGAVLAQPGCGQLVG